VRKSAKSAPLGGAKAPIADREPVRDRHGFRGTPGPAVFDVFALPDSAPLTDFEACSILRVSTNTTASWRRRGVHLTWFVLPNGQVRTTAGSVKALLARGETRPHEPRADRATINPPKPHDRKPKSVRRPSRRADHQPEAPPVP